MREGEGKHDMEATVAVLSGFTLAQWCLELNTSKHQQHAKNQEQGTMFTMYQQTH